jgi:hypothetical protein
MSGIFVIKFLLIVSFLFMNLFRLFIFIYVIILFITIAELFYVRVNGLFIRIFLVYDWDEIMYCLFELVIFIGIITFSIYLLNFNLHCEAKYQF